MLQQAYVKSIHLKNLYSALYVAPVYCLYDLSARAVRHCRIDDSMASR